MRSIGQFIAVLLVVGFIGAYFWWLLLGATLVGLAWLATRWYQTVQDEAAESARRLASVVARADQQHAWVLAGDQRGVHGDYPPAT